MPHNHRSLPKFLLLAVGVLLFASVVWDIDIFGDPEDDTKAGDPNDDDKSGDTARTNLYDLAATTGRFGTFCVALKTAGLVDTMTGDGPFTLFAPTDDAFGTLGETLDELLADPERLATILKHHVIQGTLASGDLEDGAQLTTLDGTTLTVSVGDTITIGGATVTDPDLTASNGIIHGIDAVLGLPEQKKEKKKKKE